MRQKLLLALRPLLFIPAIIIMGIIYGFSNDTGESSSSLSLEVTQTIVEVVDTTVYDNTMDSESFSGMVEKLHLPVRKTAHFSEYALLALFVFLPLLTYKINICVRFAVPVIWSFIYACIDEIHQKYIPDRSCSIIDVFIDTSGAVLCMMFVYITYCISKRITKKRRRLIEQ